MKAKLFLPACIVLGFTISGCEKNLDTPDVSKSNFETNPNISVVSADFYNDLFTRYGGGWTGGERCYSYELPDGRILWAFGPSLLDTVYEDRTRPFSPMIQNCFVVQDGTEMTTLHGGSPENPTAYVVPADGSGYYWPGAGVVRNNKLYMIMLRMISTTGTWPFGQENVGSDLAVFNLPDLTLESLSPLVNLTDVRFGLSIYYDEDFVYVYSARTVIFYNSGMVMRFDPDDINQQEFYDGAEWVTNLPMGYMKTQGEVKPVRVQDMFSVVKEGGKYRLLTHRDPFGTAIHIYSSDTPFGPWMNRRLVLETDTFHTEAPSVRTFLASVHPHIVDPENGMLMSYSVTSTNLLDILGNADNFRPMFYWVKIADN